MDFQDFNISLEFDSIRKRSKESFKNLVKRKSEEFELKRLTAIQEGHSKMENLYYTEVKMQEYMKTPGISVEQAQNLFRWRVRMSPFGENFRGGQEKVICPLCHNHMDSQSLALNCEEIRKEVQIKLRIEDIYRDNITLQTA